MAMPISDTLAVLKELSEAVSLQARVVNRYWLSVAAVSLFVIVPRERWSGADSMSVPWLGDVADAPYFFFSGLLMSLLIIAFSCAHAQQSRTISLANRMVGRLHDDIKELLGEHVRDLFDAMRLPGVTRVAPLAQALQGKSQFLTDDRSMSDTRRNLTTILYMILKIIVTGVYFLLPCTALIAVFWKYSQVQPPYGCFLHVAVWFCGGMALLSLSLAICIEAKGLGRAVPLIARRGMTSNI